METMLFLEQDVDERSPTLNCIIEIARRKKCDLKCVFLVPVSLEMEGNAFYSNSIYGECSGNDASRRSYSGETSS